jgi:hypothetical protein
MIIWYILCSSGTFSDFGIMYQEKSGIPELLRVSERDKTEESSYLNN